MTTPLLRFKGHRGSVNALLCEEDKHPHVLASGSDDGTCRLWDLRTTRATRCMNIKKALGVTGQEDDAGESAVNSLAFSNAKQSCIYVAAGNKVLTFDLRKEGMIFNCADRELWQDNDDEINVLSRHPNKQGKYISAPDDNGDIRIYDTESHRLFKTLRGQHTNICSCALFRPNAPWDLVSGGMDGFVLFWDFSRGRTKFKIDLNAGVNSINTTSTTSSSAGTGGSNQMFNPPLVHSMAFAPNGKTFVAGLGDATIAVVDYNSRQILRRLKHHNAAVSQVHFPVFHPNEWLLSSGNDAKICIWDYKHTLNNTSTPAIDEMDTSAPNPDVVKEFNVALSPNAITTSLHQNLVHVCDISYEITAYPLM